MGLHFPYGSVVNLLISDIQYYAKEPDCEYKWLPSLNGRVVGKSIDVQSPSGKVYQIGRVFANNSWHVGAVFAYHGGMHYGYLGAAQFTRSYEVLICIKESNESSTTETPPDVVELTAQNIEQAMQLQDLTTQLKDTKKEVEDLKANLAEMKSRLKSKVLEISDVQLKLSRCELQSL